MTVASRSGACTLAVIAGCTNICGTHIGGYRQQRNRKRSGFHVMLARFGHACGHPVHDHINTLTVIFRWKKVTG